MTNILSAGENVRHNKRAEWGIGKIIKLERGGTIRVVFEGNKDVSIAKGAKYLTKISSGMEAKGSGELKSKRQTSER